MKQERPSGATETRFVPGIERDALTLKRAPALEEAGEYQKAWPAGNGPAETYQAGAFTALARAVRWVATNPECKGAQIFQKSHRQIAEVGRRSLLMATGLYFLHKIRLNFQALEFSQRTLQAPKA
ncbi:MAG TPA: hypothetical protein VKL99_07485 [Candidatus Angelobacter sp.]|nr:hypothetical protein [Candidatus Angelobacter sp.]